MGVYQRGLVWWISFSHEGMQYRRSTTAPNRKTAEKIYYKVRTDFAEGKFFEVEEGSRRTFEELAQKYEDQVGPELKSWKSSQSYFKQLKTFFGPHLLTKIKAPLIDEFKQLRKAKGIKPATINRQLNIFKRMLNLAKKRWMWIKDVPMIEMEPKADKKRLRFLSFEEYHNLLLACEAWVSEIVIVAAWTGLRQGNILNLRRSQVNLFARTITIESEETKNDERLVIPVSKPALEVLKEKMKVVNLNSPYIFVNKNRPFYKMELQRGFKKALKTTGIEDFRFHDLRHCFATWNREAGVDINTLADLLGHKDTRMTRRYAHVTQGRLSKAVELLEKSFEEYNNSITILSQSNKKRVS
jgi:integrase